MLVIRSSRWIKVVRTLVLAGALGLLWLAVALPDAAAQPTDIELQALDPPEPTDANKHPPPEFQAIIKGALPGLEAKAFALKQTDLDPALQVTAERVTPWAKSNDKAIIVLLIEGNGRWMGNETYAEEMGEDPEAGAFTGLAGAIDNFTSAGPAGSVATVMTYGDGKVDVKQEVAPTANLSGSVMGQQRDYEKNLDIPLIVGLKAALNILDKHGGYRRILVVIGDGTGERDDISGDLNARVDELRQRKIEVYTIFYDISAGGDPTGQANMKKLALSKAYNAESKDSIATYAKSIVEELSSRYYVGFPGCNDAKRPVCYTHDGETHPFVVLISDEESDEIELQTLLWEQPKPPKETSYWWLWLLLILSGVGIIGYLIVKKLQSREVILQPPPQEFEQPEMQAPPMAAAPAGPAKTMMLGAVGGNDSIPLVGWIVPLEGPNQFQTFKLLQGVTVIGTGGNANIVIQDGYMSTEHCQIVSSPTGFVLQDGGSTNGVYVNDQRTQSQELVDNDVMTMGKTNFKFKSIN